MRFEPDISERIFNPAKGDEPAPMADTKKDITLSESPIMRALRYGEQALSDTSKEKSEVYDSVPNHWFI